MTNVKMESDIEDKSSDEDNAASSSPGNIQSAAADATDHRSQNELKCGTEHESFKDSFISHTMVIIFLTLEIILGIACFGVEVGWELGSSFVDYYDKHPNETHSHDMVHRTRLFYTTTTMFPFIIMTTILISLAMTRKFSVYSVVALVACMFGCLLFMACGIVAAISTDLPGVNIMAMEGFAGLAIATAVLFAINAFYLIYRLYGNSHSSHNEASRKA